MSPVSRTPEWVEREYGREKWPAIEALIEEETKAGGSLSQVLGRVARREGGGQGGALDEREATVAGGTVEVPWPVARWGYQGLIVEAVVGACEPETDLVLELGAGWGRNLLLAWLLGGPRAARYAAAEFTESGCRAAGKLAALDTQLDFETLRFDYREPDLGRLGGARHAVAFSAHSVENVPELPEGALDQIAALGERVTCIHFEPVGWQAEAEDGRAGSSREYAEENDYNRNLLAALRSRERAGVLEVESVRTEVVGLNPRNSTSVVAWRSAQAAG